MKKSFYHFGFVSNCNTHSFFPPQTISSVRFYYPLQIAIEKCLKHYGEKGNMRQRNEKTQELETLLKKIGPTNKHRDIAFETLPEEEIGDVILISG